MKKDYGFILYIFIIQTIVYVIFFYHFKYNLIPDNQFDPEKINVIKNTLLTLTVFTYVFSIILTVILPLINKNK